MGYMGRLGGGVALVLGAALLSTAASATEGYFQNGIGARHKGLAGAGVADGRDATSVSLNPAGIVRAGNELDFSASLFAPFRKFEGSGFPGFTPLGTVESERELFVVPNMARNWKITGSPWLDAFTLSMSGNGGMNTTYKPMPRTSPPCPPGGAGVYCGGKAGVDLTQILISAGAAKRFGNFSVGIAPTLAVQFFEAEGLGLFTGASLNGAKMTDNGHDIAFGGGLRAGVEWSVAPGFRVGVAGATPIWSQPFGDYKGLFAEGGDFDIPANIQAGIAVDLSPNFTVMLDYRHIWFSSVDSVGNPSTNALLGIPFGASNGPGFGWDDVDSFKVGMEWRATDKATLRAGYSYNTQPVKSRDVMLNILAPAVSQHHITAGMTYRMSDNWDMEFAGMYSPRGSVSGPELDPPFGAGVAHTIDLSMYQFEATIGFKYRFDSPEPLK